MTSSWSDAQHPAALATVDASIGYYPSGALKKMTLGNGLTETGAYNNRLQPCRMETNSTAAALAACGDATPSGNILNLTYGFNSGTADNGNVATWNATGAQTFSRSYTYDGLNRLATMAAPGDTCTGLSWTYDAWGNRTDQNYTGGTCGTFHATVGTNNRLTTSGYTYDAAGNMTHDASHSYTYDAENRTTQVDAGSTATYVYDASGQRVRRTVGSTVTDYFYDLGGSVAAERVGSSWTRASVYAGSGLLAQYDNTVTPATTFFALHDHLGSTRLLTNISGGIYDSYDYFPFGESIGGGGGTSHKFTGYERDSESGLDNAQARYDSSSLGRFMSADPAGNSVADHSDPQTWNMYSYVRNNPVNLTDPTGMSWSFSFGFGGGGGGGNCNWCELPPSIPQLPPFGSGGIPMPKLGGTAGPGFGGCDFGSCSGRGFFGDELHHVFSQQFEDWFEEHGVDISRYLIPLSQALHRLKPNGIHTKLGGNWNQVWKKWIEEHPNATPEEIINQGKKILGDFGIAAGDIFGDFIIIVDPCRTNPTMSFCRGSGGGA